MILYIKNFIQISGHFLGLLCGLSIAMLYLQSESIEEIRKSFYICGLTLTVPATFAVFIYSQLFNLSSHRALSYTDVEKIEEIIIERIKGFGRQIIVYVCAFFFCIATTLLNIQEQLSVILYVISSGFLGLSAFYLVLNTIFLGEIIKLKLTLDYQEKYSKATKDKIDEMEKEISKGFKPNSDLESYTKINYPS